MMCVDDDDDRNDCSTVAPMTINYCQIGCDSEKTDSITKSLGGWLDFGENDNPSAATRGWTNTIQIPDKYNTNTGQILLMTMVKEFIGSQRVEYDSV